MAVSLQGIKNAGGKACNWTAETRVVQGTKKLGNQAVKWATPAVDPHKAGFTSLDRSVTRAMMEKVQDQQEEGGFINFFLTRGEASVGVMVSSLYDAGTHGIQGVYQIPLAVLKGATRTVGITNDGRSFSQDVVEGARHVSRALRNTVLAVGSVLGLLAPGCVQVVDGLVGATDVWDTYKAQTVKEAAATYLGQAKTKLTTLKDKSVQMGKDHPRATKVAVGTLATLGLAIGGWYCFSGDSVETPIGPENKPVFGPENKPVFGPENNSIPDAIPPQSVKNFFKPTVERLRDTMSIDLESTLDWAIDHPVLGLGAVAVTVGGTVGGTVFAVKKAWNKFRGNGHAGGV